MNQIDFSFTHIFQQLTKNINDLLPLLPNALATLVFGILVIRLLSWTGSWLLGFIRMPRGLRTILISLMDVILGVFLTIQVLKSLGLDDLALAITAGVAAIGIAVGNGSVAVVSDVIAGVYLARDRDFGIGDIVIAGEERTKGEILSMDLRRTRIRDEDGQIHSIPNSVIERKEYILVTKRRDREDFQKAPTSSRPLAAARARD
jgi:small-conductance mechanosensitive channel